MTAIADEKQHKKRRHGHNHSGSAIDFYAVNSGIRNWDPRFKLAFSLALLIYCLLADNPVISLIIILTAAFISVGLGKLPFDHYLEVMTIPLTFILLGSIAVAIDFSKSPAGDWNLYLGFAYMYVSRKSLQSMLFLMLKAFGAISAMFIMTLSTPAFELFSVLKRMHCPSLIVELMHMIYRFIFILFAVHENMRISAEARLGFCDFKTSCYSFGHIAGNLFVVSLKKANAYYDAMEARCYDGEFEFLEEEYEFPKKKAAAALMYFVLLTAVYHIVR